MATSVPVVRPALPTNTPKGQGGGSVTRCVYEALIRSVWRRDADWAVRIAWRESRCEPGVTSPDGAKGLFQLLGHENLAAGGCSLYEAACNVAAAWRLYEIAGRAPWAL